MRLSYRTVAMLAAGRYSDSRAVRFDGTTSRHVPGGIDEGRKDRAAQRALDWANTCEERAKDVRCEYSSERGHIRVLAVGPNGSSWRVFR